MNEGIHLDLDTWIDPGQIRKANLCRGLGNRYTPAGTEVLISAVAVVLVLYGNKLILLYCMIFVLPYIYIQIYNYNLFI